MAVTTAERPRPDSRLRNGKTPEPKETHTNTSVSETTKQAQKDIGGPRQDDSELKDYQLGDCLGKGAFGSVFRALNMSTGETVAVKQVKLTDLPKSELRVITLEIDLLKNLDHPNIVKYRGFVKSADTLDIILEYCENGSLHSISKNFGKFPENLVGMYMSQVLHGLLYLHDQGVIHRDIKGANILTTKQGLVKLADFGVATKTTTIHGESSVVGTPYWMAPEVIELSGATTASDIWSLGCTVIELLDGRPPYHKLQPMHALFRIVNDDHPPLPDGASPVVRDFLMQCFQKDPNLRVTARKLLKHPWIVNARRADAVIPKKPTEYDEAVKSVQQWNEALKSPDSMRKVGRPISSSPIPGRRDPANNLVNQPKVPSHPSKPRVDADLLRAQEDHDDNWDNDFASAISPSALQLPHLRPQDNFGGLLSAEKLKSYASFETATKDVNWDDNYEGELTVKSPLQPSASNPILNMTSAAPNKTKASPKKSSPIKKPPSNKSPPSGRRPQKTRQVGSGKAPSKKSLAPIMSYGENEDEDFSELIVTDDAVFDRAPLANKTNRAVLPEGLHSSDPSRKKAGITGKMGGSLRRDPARERQPSMRRTRSSVEIQRYAEDEEDEDFSELFQKVGSINSKADSERSSEAGTLMLQSKLSNNSWLGDEDDDDDPFAQVEEGFGEMDLEAKVARDKFARVCTQVESLVGSLKTSQSDAMLAEISEELSEILLDVPETRSVIISAHGMLPILEILENCRNRDIIFHLIRTVNTIIFEDVEIQENLCFVGGIPILTKFASKKYSSDIRLEAAAFVRQMYQTSTLTLQMFVSAGGLKVLVEFLEEDYDEERDLVLIGVNGIWSVFDLQGPTPKNDFCRILSRSSVLDPLSLVLHRVLDEEGELAEVCEGRIANIFFLFSQAENHVKELVADRSVLHRVLKDLKRMSPNHQITMLKFIKNLSMLSTTLDSIHSSNAIDVLTDLLREKINEHHYREISNQILNTIYNLCRLNKTRQTDAALNGVIPVLQKIVKTKSPLKEFALPVLCDMAHSGNRGRRELWRNKGLQFYVSLLADPYWQVTALDAIFIWLQEETAKVEEHLLMDDSFTQGIVQCFTTSKANAFENLLEPLQKLLRLSVPIACSLAHPDLFNRILSKLNSSKAVVRLNLLRIIRSICDSSDEGGNPIARYGLLEHIQHLAEHDPAVLVRNMASEILKSSEAIDRMGNTRSSVAGSSRRPSSSTTPPGLLHSQSVPHTPTSSTPSRPSTRYFLDREPRQRSYYSPAVAYRPTSRDSVAGSGNLANSLSNLNAVNGPGTPSGAEGITTIINAASASTGNNPPPSSRQPTKSRLPRTSTAPNFGSSMTQSHSKEHVILSPSSRRVMKENEGRRSGARDQAAGGAISPSSAGGPAMNSTRRRRQVSGGRWS